MAFQIPGNYELRARVIPAIIAILPALALASMLITWTQLDLTNVLLSGAVIVLFILFGDLARRRGRALEPALYQEMGGKPSTMFLRHRDSTFDAPTKKRYLTFLAAKLGEEIPSTKAEESSPADADGFYERCGTWIRERTRDTLAFKILFHENMTYGSRRNLYGIKPFGLTLNAIVVCLCVLYIWLGPLPMAELTLKQIILVLVVAIIHAGYLLFFVTRDSVKEASRLYGRQLILCSEKLLGDDDAKPKKKK